MLITIKEYAKIVNRSESTIRSAVFKGKIPYEKDNQRVYIDSETPWFAEEARHGLSHHPLACTWSGMKQRCYNPKSTSYKTYGERGITVCNEWLHDFPAFVRWAECHGYKQGLTIDRIDNDKGYCRFITRSENAIKSQVDRKIKLAKIREEMLEEVIEVQPNEAPAEASDKMFFKNPFRRPFDEIFVECKNKQWYMVKRIKTAKKEKSRRATNKMNNYLYFLKNGFVIDFYDDICSIMSKSIYVLPKTAYEIPTPSDEYIEDFIKATL